MNSVDGKKGEPKKQVKGDEEAEEATQEEGKSAEIEVEEEKKADRGKRKMRTCDQGRYWK